MGFRLIPVPRWDDCHEALPARYSILDSLIIAAAIHVVAITLYSEDMRDGQVIEALTIRNPFTR
jgi:predicted nucleic acid-binding protein